MSGFSFEFSGEDIEEAQSEHPLPITKQHAAETGTLTHHRASNSAFPIPGQTLLPPQHHDFLAMIKDLPSQIAYSTLVVQLDDGGHIKIPRRELWDVRAQLMSEDDDESLGNLGKDDVRTGVYEGGFKSWESSVDVVKELHHDSVEEDFKHCSRKVLELGCGTALPSLAIAQWYFDAGEDASGGLSLGLADYNPTVLRLVTLPNLLLSWAQFHKRAHWEAEGTLDVDERLVEEFLYQLKARQITVSFFSGAWGSDFVKLITSTMSTETGGLTIFGAETIYSPFALASFAETLVELLQTMPDGDKKALIAAKTVYFGVGGSMVDFCRKLKEKGAAVKKVREESDGVRREVIEVTM